MKHCPKLSAEAHDIGRLNKGADISVERCCREGVVPIHGATLREKTPPILIGQELLSGNLPDAKTFRQFQDVEMDWVHSESRREGGHATVHHLLPLLIIGLIKGAVHPIAVLFPFAKVEGRILTPRPSHIRPPLVRGKVVRVIDIISVVVHAQRCVWSS